MTNYQVGDFLIRIKNAAMVGSKEVSVKSTNLVAEVAKTLKDEGFLDEIETKKGILSVRLSFFHKKPRIQNITLVSRPGLRIYADVDELTTKKSPEIYILTTPMGVMSDRKAIKNNVGGEVLAKVL